MSDLLKLSGRLGSMTNLVHGFIYFAPEASEEFDALGLPADHHYFASRGRHSGRSPPRSSWPPSTTSTRLSWLR